MSSTVGAAVTTGLRHWNRAERMLGLGLGTVAGANPFTAVAHLIPGTKDWLPDVERTPQAAKAFWDVSRTGDWDAAIEAYQDEMDAGPRFWGLSELGTAVLAPLGLAKTGVGLTAKALPMAQTLGKAVPARIRPAVVKGAEKGLRGTGQAMRAPWELEEAIGRGIAYPFRKGWQKFRGGPAAETAEEVAEGLGATPGRTEIEIGGERAIVADDIPTPEQAMELDELAGPVITPEPRVTAEEVAEGLEGLPGRTEVEIGGRRAVTGEPRVMGAVSEEAITTPARKRTVEELLAAGEYKTPQTKDEVAWQARNPQARDSVYNRLSKTPEQIQAYLDDAVSQARVYRSIEGKAQQVFDDLDEFSSREVEFLEDLIPGKTVYQTYPPSPGDEIMNLSDIRAAVRPEMSRLDREAQYWGAQLAEKTKLDNAAREAAMQRGIERLGLEQAPTTRVAGQVAEEAATPVVRSVVTGFRQGASTKSLPKADQLKDNYLKPLSEYTDRLFHETDIKGANSFTAVNLSEGPTDIFWANNANMARGQTGKGVLLEFSAEGVEGQINRSKPAWKAAFDNGEAEFLTKYRGRPGMRDNLISVTVEEGTFQSQGSYVRNDKRFRNPYAINFRRTIQNWPQTKNPDGSVTYTRPPDEIIGTPPPATAEEVAEGLGGLPGRTEVEIGGRRAVTGEPRVAGEVVEEAITPPVPVTPSIIENMAEELAKAENTLKLAKRSRGRDRLERINAAQEEVDNLNQMREYTLEAELSPDEWQQYQDFLRKQDDIMTELQIMAETRPERAPPFGSRERSDWDYMRRERGIAAGDTGRKRAKLKSDLELINREIDEIRKTREVPFAEKKLTGPFIYHKTNLEALQEIQERGLSQGEFVEGLAGFQKVDLPGEVSLRVSKRALLRSQVKEVDGVKWNIPDPTAPPVSTSRIEVYLDAAGNPVPTQSKGAWKPLTDLYAAAPETPIAPVAPATATGRIAGKGPPKPPSKAEAEFGPEDVGDLVTIDPLEALGASPALGRWSKKINSLKDLLPGFISKRVRRRTEEVEGAVETARRIQDTIKYRAESSASTMRHFVRSGMRKWFTMDPQTGHILDPALQNRVRVETEYPNPSRPDDKPIKGELILESPTLQDIAARYDAYEPFLTKDQKKFMTGLRNSVETGTVWGKSKTQEPAWNQVFRENIPGWDLERVRGDITGNGFYLSRGRTRTPDKKTFSVTEELEKFVKEAKDPSKRAPIPAEKEAVMPAMGKLVNKKGKVVNAGLRYDLPDRAVGEYIVGVADRVADTNIDERLKELAKAYAGTKKVKPGRVREIGIVRADDALADAINREFGRSALSRFANLPIIKQTNNLYRAIKANWDLSAIGIHGNIAMYRDPKNFGRATGLIFKSLAASVRRKDGLRVLDEATSVFDQTAADAGRLTSRQWAALGGRQGGAAVETAFPGAERMMESGVPVVGKVLRGVGESLQVSNRLFGGWGDYFRLLFWDELLRHEIASGKTIKQLVDSGELRQIAQSGNRMTGWSDQRFAGDIGELAMFAARFFQTRIEMYAQGALGAARLRPPTLQSMRTLGQTRMNIPLQMERGGTRGIPIGGGRRLTESGKPLIQSDVLSSMGRAQTIENREGLRSLIRLFGWAVAATELINAKIGHETDRRPFVNGRANPNFYRIRFEGRDFSLFGPAVGLYRAIATVAADPTPNGLLEASRSFGSGVSRLVWDNITGFTFMGDPAPLRLIPGIKKKRLTPEAGSDPLADPKGFVGSPSDILKYISELSLPIAPEAVVGEIIEGVKSALEGDWGRAIGAAVAAPAEALGWQVSTLSRGDERTELAKELYNKPYEELTGRVQGQIDDAVTARMGERAYTGPLGYLYKKKDEINNTLIEGLQKAATEFLSAPTTSADWSSRLARQEYNNLRKKRAIALNGARWDPEKQRMVGGVNERLYDRDKEREKPDPGTKEHRAWQYYKIFEDATGEDGELDWERVDELSSHFWHNVIKTRSQAEELLEDIRLIEDKYPEEFKKLANAGRYATVYTQNIEGQKSNYWDLKKHPKFIKFVADKADVTESTVREYLNLSSAAKEAQRHVPGKARKMQEAINESYSDSGVVGGLQKQFVDRAWKDYPEWIIAMRDAGYKYRGSEDKNNLLRQRVRDPDPSKRIVDPNYSASEYEKLYLDQLVPR